MSIFTPVSFVKMYLLAYHFLFLSSSTIFLPPPPTKLLFSTLHYFHRLPSTPTHFIKKNTFITLKQPLCPPSSFKLNHRPIEPPSPLYPPLPVYIYHLNISSLLYNTSSGKLVKIILKIMNGMFYIFIFLYLTYLISFFTKPKFFLENNSNLIFTVFFYGILSYLINLNFSLLFKNNCICLKNFPTVFFHTSLWPYGNGFFCFYFNYIFKKAHAKLQKTNLCIFINLGYKYRHHRTQHRNQPYSEGRRIVNNYVLGFSVDFLLLFSLCFLFYGSLIYKFHLIIQIDFSFLYYYLHSFFFDSCNAKIFVHFCENILIALCPPTFSFKYFVHLIFSLPIFILHSIHHNFITFNEFLNLAIILVLLFFNND